MGKLGGEFPQITLSDDRLDIKLGADWGLRIRWASIELVALYKKDCFGFDQIRMEILAGENCNLLTEDDTDWDLLIEKLPEFLPGALSREEWWNDVVQPPFAECYTEIFERDGSGRTTLESG